MNHSKGIDYPIKEIDKEAHIVMLQNMIERGKNHKFALSDEQRLHITKLVQQDAELGHTIPIPVECIKNITSRSKIYPIGYQDQLTINERGKKTPRIVSHMTSHTTEERAS